ncbi:uncharacterized protein K452DRAFT_263819 [Aplosporella prunicola CBS 121167]|uniref:Heterokaryon incompatibility domain-containing protein n=1 Tax=Aplosporella prunicola CBS 121167 TaxID=1176127 RepID=A0A6A6BQZ9_9PEZI|nr:uncharacterized protein K452DRAFT_263819 [Aplosporella prunicola CBS 121167]KAF2146188.1 hypothetical protein K452DRAFT_263819 [Aplosporella prunicola CBS 121167]
MLCAMCVSVFRNPDRKGPHHARLEHVERAASAGCKICSILQNKIVAFTKEHPDHNTLAPCLRYIKFKRLIRFDILWANFNKKSLQFLNIEPSRTVSLPECYDSFLALANDDLATEPWRVRRDGFYSHFPPNTGHLKVAEQASAWLQNCIGYHESCETCDPTRDTTWYPKRLINVTTPRKPRLSLTTFEKPNGRYATLSHCWGPNPQFMVLSSDNEERLRHQLPINKLPRAFQDAIITTERLGIPYLWIDSLCILQKGDGSEEDWREHTVAMRQVYLNCVLNIAVDHGKDPHCGAFQERDTLALQKCNVLGYVYGSDEGIWSVFHNEKDSFYVSMESPLSCRAWAVQERLLSPRILHFGSAQISWECNEEEFLLESLPEAHENPVTSPHRIWPFSIPMTQESTSSNQIQGHSLTTLRSAWWTIVEVYAKGGLTKPHKDKFVALAGIAERFASLYGHDYLAGIFRCDFPVCLLWNTLPGSSRPTEDGYRAPTWSWASVDGPICMESDLYKDALSPETAKELTTVKDIQVVHLHQNNIYGQLKSASIHLCGLLFCFSTPLPQSVNQYSEMEGFIHSINEPRFMYKLGFRLDDENDFFHPESLFAFPVLQHLESKTIDGLILKPTNVPKVYKRLGLFKEGYLGDLLEGHPRQELTIV